MESSHLYSLIICCCLCIFGIIMLILASLGIIGGGGNKKAQNKPLSNYTLPNAESNQCSVIPVSGFNRVYSGQCLQRSGNMISNNGQYKLMAVGQELQILLTQTDRVGKNTVKRTYITQRFPIDQSNVFPMSVNVGDTIFALCLEQNPMQEYGYIGKNGTTYYKKKYVSKLQQNISQLDLSYDFDNNYYIELTDKGKLILVVDDLLVHEF